MEMVDIENLLREISSESPAPGGGSVAALSGCFGSALVSMVCKLSIGKKKYKEIENELKEVLSEAEALREELLKLSKQDVEAFNEVIAASKMSDEKEGKKGIQIAYKRAADVPFKVSKKCLRVMELAEFTASKGNQNALTDSAVAALMAYSGLKGAVLNIKVNLKYIDDENFNNKMRKEVSNLENKAKELIKEVLDGVEASLSR